MKEPVYAKVSDSSLSLGQKWFTQEKFVAGAGVSQSLARVKTAIHNYRQMKYLNITADISHEDTFSMHIIIVAVWHKFTSVLVVQANPEHVL